VDVTSREYEIERSSVAAELHANGVDCRPGCTGLGPHISDAANVLKLRNIDRIESSGQRVTHRSTIKRRRASGSYSGWVADCSCGHADMVHVTRESAERYREVHRANPRASLRELRAQLD
jgi:hypothetical protein